MKLFCRYLKFLSEFDHLFTGDYPDTPEARKFIEFNQQRHDRKMLMDILSIGVKDGSIRRSGQDDFWHALWGGDPGKRHAADQRGGVCAYMPWKHWLGRHTQLKSPQDPWQRQYLTEEKGKLRGAKALFVGVGTSKPITTSNGRIMTTKCSGWYSSSLLTACSSSYSVGDFNACECRYFSRSVRVPPLFIQ